MRRIVRKIGIVMVLFCLTVMSMAGCKKGEMKEENQEVDKFFYSKLPKTNQKVSEEEEKKIQKGIENWAKTVLLADSSVGKQNQKLIEKSFYQSIADEKQREQVKKDRDKFYKGNDVKVQSAEAKIENAYATEYDGKSIGDVTCDVVIKGKKDGKPFSRTYHLKLAVSYVNEVVSVYEVGSISWK
ncbi:hypothetical protein [Faecalimonas umbilicata]|nr:hypothetical protein [Faecalimonas umbilicata]